MSHGIPPGNIKKEALNGLPSLDKQTGSSVHLSSFGLRRDLSLGGSVRGGRGGAKKEFKPNLNVVRNKNA